MHDLALEVRQVGNVSLQGTFVVVVACTRDYEARLNILPCSLFAVRAADFDSQSPQLLVRRPICRDQLVSKANILVDAVLLRRVPDVLLDRFAVNDHPCVIPRPPGKPKGGKVRVRANAWVAEEIPRPAHVGAGFEDSVGGIGQL